MRDKYTLVRRFWHSLQAVEARFILPSSEAPPLPFGGCGLPAPPLGGAVRGAIGLNLPTSPIAKVGGGCG
jgi:hypothetical protein